MLRPVLILVSIALALASCGSDSGAGSQELDDALDGREFWSTAVVEDGAPRMLVDGTRITLRFGEEELGASAGCNSMGGSFEVEGSTLEVADMFMTEMGCDAERHEQDQFVAGFLMSSPAITLSGNDLTLAAGNTSIELIDVRVANPDREIIGTEWTVDGFIDGQAATSFAIERPASLTLNADSTMTGFDGCADFAAPVEVSDGSTGGPVEGDGEMQFGAIDRTPSADCPNPDYVEAFYRTFTTGNASFNINGTNLTILNADGVGLTAKAGEPG